MPGSFLMGGIFMLAVDDITRSAFALEIPLGIITSLIGAPVFFIILKISSKQTW
jgi:iron complex transport system permease protein